MQSDPLLARLFLGLELDEGAKRALKRAAEALAGVAQGRFSDETLYHLTLCFLGDTSRRAIARLGALMENVGEGPFSLTLSALGTFQNGRIVWAGIMEPCDRLYRLQAALSARLSESGFPVEADAYHPHITLGRQMRVAGKLPEVSPVSFSVTRVTLFESARLAGRLAYTPLLRVPL